MVRGKGGRAVNWGVGVGMTYCPPRCEQTSSREVDSTGDSAQESASVTSVREKDLKRNVYALCIHMFRCMCVCVYA